MAMARKPEMWYRKERKAWFVTINGKRHNLGSDKSKAEKQFHKLMAAEAPVMSDSPTAAEVMERFLDWVEANRKPDTYEWYEHHLQTFLDSIGALEANKLKPLHVTEAVKPHWKPSTVRGFMIAIQRCFKWAVRQGYIDHSPLESLEKPSAERRENCPSDKEVKALLAKATEPFKSVVEFILETACRPQEVIAIEPRHVKGDVIEFPVVESKGKKRKRIIYLTDKAKEILDRNGKQFRNNRGGKWTCYSIDCRFKRLAEKLGFKVAAYDLRHYRITRWLEAGLDHITVSKLAGHATAAMVVAHYEHIGQNTERLLQQLKNATQK